MFKANISTDTTVTANTNIPFTVVKNTNSNISYDTSTNTIVFNTPGIWDLNVLVNGTDFAIGDVSLVEVIDGTASTVAVSSATTTATTDAVSFNIPDVIITYPITSMSKASVSYQLTVAGTVTSAIVIVEGRK